MLLGKPMQSRRNCRAVVDDEILLRGSRRDELSNVRDEFSENRVSTHSFERAEN
jgi:hypothetical protein